MVSLRLAVALAAVGLFTSGMVFAEGAKPNDPQIAHIAYTAGVTSTSKTRNSPGLRNQQKQRCSRLR